ncbi:hypothetical protein EX30DRAFT_394488 [Ascodesmis nigricans]|uniref:ER membrane protein complex subunit 6 n=1 Tax=Ascodesmis nigricans TaxID=341454 RepID=A0A4S2N2V6_9PEZI|nr:hypothetical protein EX30DRAFT_394488 [Ascodesmis nigricans]
MLDERKLAIDPVVPENVAHNTRIVTDIRSLTSSVCGIAAGILGLESYAGFVFYLVGSVFVSMLMLFLVADGKPGKYFQSGIDLWTTEVFGTSSVASFVLMWTLVYNLVRA